jgi:hypothetical protein
MSIFHIPVFTESNKIKHQKETYKQQSSFLYCLRHFGLSSGYI